MAPKTNNVKIDHDAIGLAVRLYALHSHSSASRPGLSLVSFAIELRDVFGANPITVDRVKLGKLKVEGALYDIDSSSVTWMGPHPKQDKLLSDKAH
jgi:hypothetical protein